MRNMRGSFCRNEWTVALMDRLIGDVVIDLGEMELGWL
jgi:hypothetical protein